MRRQTVQDLGDINNTSQHAVEAAGQEMVALVASAKYPDRGATAMVNRGKGYGSYHPRGAVSRVLG